VFDVYASLVTGLRVSELAERGGVAPSTVRFLAGRISQVREQLAELGVFERQLQTVLGRLATGDPGPERCGTGCGCQTNLDVAADGAGPDPGPWGCSLVGDALASRIGQWRAVAAAATSVERTSDTVRLVLAAAPDMMANVAELCAAETACCAQTRFLLGITAGQVTLTAEAPGTPGLLDMLFPAGNPSLP
jgi:hypothetical protein